MLPIRSNILKYSRYFSIFDQAVDLPNGKRVAYDILSRGKDPEHIPQFVCMFPYSSERKTATLIREYCQGPNEMVYGLPCGGVEKSHKSPLHAAQCELAEEAFLTGGEWVPLLPEDDPGVIEVKWGRARFFPYLVVDPVKDPSPPPRDAEEHIEIDEDVPLEKVFSLLTGGKLLLHSAQTTTMALAKLGAIKLDP